MQKNVDVEFDEADLFLPDQVPTKDHDLLKVAANEVAPHRFTPAEKSSESKAALWKSKVEQQRKAQEHIDMLLARNPLPGDSRISVRVKAEAHIKPKPNSGNIQKALIDHILTEAGSMKSQAEIRRYVEKQNPSYPSPTKDWNKPLPTWAVEKVALRIRCGSSPISNIKLPKGAVTLNDLHRLAKVAVERHQHVSQRYKAELEITDDALILNGTRFPFSVNKVKGKEYKGLRVSASSLIAALQS